MGFIIYAFTKVFSDANLMPILCTIIDTKYRATAYGILNLFACIVGGLGIYAGGILRDSQVELNHIFIFAAFIMVVCILLLIILLNTSKIEKRS